MSLPSETRFEDLLSRYLDGDLEEQDEVELGKTFSDGKFAARFLEMTMLNAEVAGLLAAPISDASMTELVMRDVRGEVSPIRPIGCLPDLMSAAGDFAASARQPARSRFSAGRYIKRVLAIAACFGVSALVCYWVLGAFRQAPASRVASLRGEVLSVGASGQVSLNSAQSLRDKGTLQTIGPESRATLWVEDHTRIELAGDTSVVFDLEKQRLYLERGTLRAHVTKLKAPENLVFATPNAETTVKGTTFSLMWKPPNSLVAVQEGTVSIKRLSDGFTVQVNAGEYAHAEPNGPRFFARPLRALPKATRERIHFSN